MIITSDLQHLGFSKPAHIHDFVSLKKVLSSGGCSRGDGVKDVRLGFMSVAIKVETIFAFDIIKAEQKEEK